MPSRLKRACESADFNTINLKQMLCDVQQLRFAGPASVINVTNAANIALNTTCKQVPINVNNTTYYLILETAAR